MSGNQFSPEEIEADNLSRRYYAAIVAGDNDEAKRLRDELMALQMCVSAADEDRAHRDHIRLAKGE